jgi:hypothetical protein
MPAGGDPRDGDGDRGSAAKPSFTQRLSKMFLKPEDPTRAKAPEKRSIEQLKADEKRVTDSERLIGLFAAPLAAMLGILIVNALIAHDPPAKLKDGSLNHLHVDVSLYHWAMLALLALAVVMLLTAWFRKRLYLGMVMALYGLTIFNLHYWGFGVPYIMIGAWLLVRSYRAHKDMKQALEAAGTEAGSAGSDEAARSLPKASKRYTPKAPPRRPAPSKSQNRSKSQNPSKSQNQQKAG